MHIKSRDLMAPDTDPTDEELALVMREARDLAMQRRATADAWVGARLKEASDFGRADTQPRRLDKSRGRQRLQSALTAMHRHGRVQFANV
jgi:hypothetical protein